MKGSIAIMKFCNLDPCTVLRLQFMYFFVKCAFKVLPVKTLHFRVLLSFLFRVFLMKVLFEVLRIKNAYVVFFMNIVL